MSKSFDLSLEQQFNIRSFEHQVKDMTHQQAQEFLVNLYRQMVLQENSYKNLLKHQWGIEEPGQQAA
jgi:Phycobilisome degradation protein nblA